MLNFQKLFIYLNENLNLKSYSNILALKLKINFQDGEIANAFDLGVYDHLETKKWAIKFAVDAVLTILRVDQVIIIYHYLFNLYQIILAKPAGGPKFDKSKMQNPENEEMQNYL